jgi:hypothetical protein
MKIRMSKGMAVLATVTLVAAATAVGIVKGAGRRKAPAAIPIGVQTGQSFPFGAVPPPPAFRIPIAVPWEQQVPKAYEGLHVGTLDGRSERPDLYKLIAAELRWQELAPPPDRVAYYDWLVNPRQHPEHGYSWDPGQLRIYGWTASIKEAEAIPGGWHATIDVKPMVECSWHHCLLIHDEFKEEYVSQNGEIRLLRSIPRQSEWGGGVSTP